MELDFLYPSEGIHRRWESGYRITSMAATADQAAFILSIPRRKMMDETQETLRTSAFPSTHVKVIKKKKKCALFPIYCPYSRSQANCFFGRKSGPKICTLRQSAMGVLFANGH